MANLVNTKLNISEDLPDKPLSQVTVSRIKMISDANCLEAEAKFIQSFSFKPQCKLLFAYNHPLKIKDRDDAFVNRVIYIPFKNLIPKGKQDKHRIFERFPYGTSAHIPLQLGYRCGLRHGEAFAVQWTDIDFDKGTLSVRHQMQFDDVAASWILTAPKYDSYRTIELDDFLLELLRKEKAKQESDKLSYDEYCKYPIWAHLPKWIIFR